MWGRKRRRILQLEEWLADRERIIKEHESLLSSKETAIRELNDHIQAQEQEIQKLNKKWAYFFELGRTLNLVNPWISTYVELLNKLKSKYGLTNFENYSELHIKDYVQNEKIDELGVWKYQRHHIDEFVVSGATIIQNEQWYHQGLSLIVSFEEHCLLHYIIVMAGFTSPNDGMLFQTKTIQRWDQIVKEQCEIFGIKYVKNWTKYLSSNEN
ncbi:MULTISPECIES: hypothetical protein [unclassified Mycoplasma]|uniref:hypothetical protein n=1 Tax=unclassified Mycoplasma TaxID=2683645 RepID=UPI00211B9857|nr:MULTISPECIES: hypothetical protein [unclassified Mycoplasma]UUM20087.1 hypothetical protein NPA11_01515 [Mycoplasma sp. 1578d]UUM25067.1 hypothetical protein NPA12_01490 [Mycoplasma sp. 3686d]